MAVTHKIMFGSLDLTDIIEQWDEGLNTRINMQSVPKRHGGLVTELPVLEPRRIRMRGRMFATSQEEMRNSLRAIEAGLGYTRKTLTIFDDRFYSAYKAGFSHAYVEGSALLVATVSIEFIADDPFEYSMIDPAPVAVQLRNTDTVVDITSLYYKKSFNITNLGSAFSFLTMTATAVLGPSFRVVVRNNTISRTQSFASPGVVLSGKSLVISNGDFTVKNDGVNELTYWSGTFLWLEPGLNELEVEGSPMDYSFSHRQRFI